MLNKVTIMGRFTKEPDIRYTQSGTPVASFTLAVDRDFSKDKEADFINCSAWQKTAEFIQKYFHKGNMAIVAGRLQVRNYEDREGNKRQSTEVVAENVYFCESKRDNISKAVDDSPNNQYQPFGEFKNVFSDEYGDGSELPF